MWSNYILTSIRTLGRNKVFVGINLLSIALAFSLCTIAYFNVQYNRDFNKVFSEAQYLYKINSVIDTSSRRIQGTTPLPLSEAITKDFPEVYGLKYQQEQATVKLGDLKFRESISFIDDEFLSFFKLEDVNGQALKFNTLNETYLTKELAIKYFGEDQAIGKVLKIPIDDQKSLTLKVVGLLKDYPENISFRFNLLVPFEQYMNINNLEKNDWSNWIDGTFIYTKTLDISTFTEAISNYIAHQNSVNKGQEISGYQVDSILAWPAYENSIEKSSFVSYLHPASVLGTLSSAIAVLLLAIFNFINSSIAISQRRLKEIGMRKVLGGRNRDLRIQFMTESLFQILIALCLSVVITHFLSKAYNAMFPFEIVEFSRVSLLPFIGLMTTLWIITGFLAGIYPAFYVSKFKSNEILKNKVRFSKKNLFMKVLLTFQLMVCIYNVFSLIVFVENAAYQKTLDRGYVVHQAINIPIEGHDQFEPLKAELEAIPFVDQVTGTVDPIGFSSKNQTIDHLGMPYDVATLRVGKGYLESLGVRLAQGEFYGENEGANEQHVLVNNMFADGVEGDILNQWILLNDQRFRVIGIVDDFNLKPIMLDNKIQPTVIFAAKSTEFTHINAFIKNQDVEVALVTVRSAWNKLFPERLFLGFPQADVLGAIKETNKIMVSINGFVALITLLISTLGLYTMVCLNIQRRLKEFGIRKVLGAPLGQILILINKEVLYMLAIASVLGLVLGHFVINVILDIVYAYHKEILQANYVWPVLILLAIVGLAIGYRSFVSAKENPVQQLRLE
ncbi:ABC transporter permease [Roseivirga sp.]|uniref:ABC transporter permease n=1 Tax=Roseivirga sp. TaxID=1964215 RepID=UPI003B8DEBD1